MARHKLSSAFSPLLRRLVPADFSRRRVRPHLEALEDRITPTTFTPTSFADDGTINSLRSALNAANADTGTATDTIQLQAGTYTLSIPNAAGHEQANASGDLNITSTRHALVIEGATDANGKPTSIIQQTVADRVFQIVNASTVTFENLIIEGGFTEDDGSAGAAAGSAAAEGGGILADAGNITLSNVVLQNNAVQAGSGFDAKGGGIYAGQGGVLTIQSSTIQSNSAIGGTGGLSGTNANSGNGEGGGVYALGQASITNSTLSGNRASGGTSRSATGLVGGAYGGGIYGLDITAITGSTLSGNTLDGGNGSTTLDVNEAQSGGSAEGGGVFLGSNSQDVTNITGSTLVGNTLAGGIGEVNSGQFSGDVGGDALGGSIYTSDNTLALTASTLGGNTLIGGLGIIKVSNPIVAGDLGGDARGGSIFAGGPTTITTSILSGNTLTGGNGTVASASVEGTVGGSAAGGGAYFSSKVNVNNTVTITASTLSGNTLTGGDGSDPGDTVGTAQGGGAYVGNVSAALINSTIADNQVIGGQQGTASGPVASGGGLFFGNLSGATLTNLTVADNKASLPQGGTGTTSGGGIANVGGTVNLVNTLVALNSATASPDFSGPVSGSDHNLIGNADGSTGFSTAQGDLLGSTTNPLSLELGPLANNGGPTQTIALLPGNLALHAGDPGAQSVTGPFDQRGQGFARVVNGTIDIGAFEVQPPPSPPPPPSSPPTPKPPPTLHTPSLLALFDELLHGVEMINGNDTETVIDSIFGISLLVSTYDGAGNLESVILFGTNVTSLFELA